MVPTENVANWPIYYVNVIKVTCKYATSIDLYTKYECTYYLVNNVVKS